ncbi:MAG: 50S ribosomal protein L3 [Candidatus Doudnabacteria bacterium]|nr:50S ribosomal protein L3 [Candidatus Doudnabacteria bacterium]
MNFIVGKKVNMTQYFEQSSGTVIPVTVVKATPIVVTQVKTVAGKDAYNAVQIAAGKKKKVSKPLQGHSKELGTFSVLTEFKTPDAEKYARGQKLDLSTFQVGEFVDVVGTSKGRGFAGVVKRHHFAGAPASHGHDHPRAVGSIGQRWPQHVRKGLRMAGHMGNERVTVKNLQVVHVDVKKSLISLKGAIPGHRNALVKIVSTGKVKPLVRIEEIKEVKKK